MGRHSPSQSRVVIWVDPPLYRRFYELKAQVERFTYRRMSNDEYLTLMLDAVEGWVAEERRRRTATTY